MLYRILFLSLFCFKLFSVEHVDLKTPSLSREEIIGMSVGVRPYRKTGVRLEAERYQDKLIIHNYGYGGSGLTLAFGGSSKVLEILKTQQVSSKVAAVLGAGIAGLTTAYDLLEKGYEVHLYAEKWSPELTSNVAAGSWTPLLSPEGLSQQKKELHQELLEISEQRLLKSIGEDPEFAGVSWMHYYNTNAVQEKMPTLLPAEEVVLHFDNGLVKKGLRAHKVGIDGKLFMEDLFSKVKSKEAHLTQKQFGHLEEILNLNEPIVINCLSLSSRELFNDPDFIPVRGHLVHFKPQEIGYVLAQRTAVPGYFLFIYPRSDSLFLGGTYEVGEEEPTLDPNVIEKLIQNGEDYFSGDL